MCPTRCDISYVLDFLAELFDESCQYNTFGLHRSALLAFHDPAQGTKMGDCPRVCDLMSGVFNQRPPQPKYTFIWDDEVVLEYVKKLPENNLLSDKTSTFMLFWIFVRFCFLLPF